MEHGTFEAASQYVPITDELVKEIAVKYQSGDIFGSWQIAEHDMHLVSSIFMPLVFIDEITRKEFLRDGRLYYYSEMKEAGPRSINGYPMFMSLSSLNLDDVKRVLAKAEAIQKAIDAI